MSSNSNHLSDINSILSLFSSFFKSATSAHPKTSLLNSHLTSFTNFLLANKDDLSKGFQFLNNLKASITVPEPLIEPIEQLEQINKDRNEISINDLKINDSQYKFFNELKEYDFLQEVKAYFYDQKLFSYENILFCVSVKYWELILNNIDKNNLNLMENVKEKIFYDSLPQNIQEKILEFLNKIEEIQKINHLGYKKSFEYFLISIKTIDFFTIMVPMIKQIIIKFLINSDWNYLRDKLQDKLNPNSLNQIFALFKNNSSNPQKDTDIINFEENTHNFLQILALGLNANIKVLWSNSNSETNISLKNFYCKNKDEIIGEIHLFIFKNQNKIWYYFNLVKNVEEKIIIEEKNEFKKQSNPFLKSHSIKINDEMFSNNNKNQIFSNETMLGSVQLKKQSSIDKSNYLIEFINSFEEKSDEIYNKFFNANNLNETGNKIQMKRFLSTELHNKDISEDAIFLSTSNNNKKKDHETKTAVNKMGFVQKCSKCPKEYVEYEIKSDKNYLCYICR